MRYPIGRFSFQDPFRTEDRPLFLAQLADAPGKLRAAVAGLSDDQLDTPYRPGGWTVRQVVHHLADAHMNWYIRPKLAVTEETPSPNPTENSSGRSLPMRATAQLMPHSRSSKAFLLVCATSSTRFRPVTGPEPLPIRTGERSLSKIRCEAWRGIRVIIRRT